jgi:hypothetical protein
VQKGGPQFTREGQEGEARFIGRMAQRFFRRMSMVAFAH